MKQENPIKETMAGLRKAIEDKDFSAFSKEHAKIVNFCRRALFHADREALDQWYAELSPVLIWFYGSKKGEWPKAERSMGGLDLLLSLMGNFLDTRSIDETLAEVRRSSVDRLILKTLSQDRTGTRSGDLAEKLERSQNSITNRLPRLEQMGLIIRSKRGKGSVVYLTPKGRGIAEDLRKEEASGVLCNWPPIDTSADSPPVKGPTGQEAPPGEPVLFWNLSELAQA